MFQESSVLCAKVEEMIKLPAVPEKLIYFIIYSQSLLPTQIHDGVKYVFSCSRVNPTLKYLWRIKINSLSFVSQVLLKVGSRLNWKHERV